MSLTKEEREFVVEMRNLHEVEYPTQCDLEIKELCKFIDRLVAENEELEREKEEITEHRVSATKAALNNYKRLTALVEAAEPIERLIPTRVDGGLFWHTQESIKAVENLNNAVKEAKG